VRARTRAVAGQSAVGAKVHNVHGPTRAYAYARGPVDVCQLRLV